MRTFWQKKVLAPFRKSWAPLTHEIPNLTAIFRTKLNLKKKELVTLRLLMAVSINCVNGVCEVKFHFLITDKSMRQKTSHLSVQLGPSRCGWVVWRNTGWYGSYTVVHRGTDPHQRAPAVPVCCESELCKKLKLHCYHQGALALLPCPSFDLGPRGRNSRRSTQSAHPLRGGPLTWGPWQSEGLGTAGRDWRPGTGIPGGTCPGDCDGFWSCMAPRRFRTASRSTWRPLVSGCRSPRARTRTPGPGDSLANSGCSSLACKQIHM